MHRDNGNNLRCADRCSQIISMFKITMSQNLETVFKQSSKYDIDYSTYLLMYALLSCVYLLHIKSRHISYVAEFMGLEIHFIWCEMHFGCSDIGCNKETRCTGDKIRISTKHYLI